MVSKSVLLIEVFYGGSHKQLIDLLYRELSEVADLITLPAKKWHWRSLTSSLPIAEIIPKDHSYRILFTSSVLPLSQLIAIRPDLAKLKKIVYFHENQLNYPVREWKTRYFQHGFNEVLTCLTADKAIFNSHYNKESFLSSLPSYFNIMPDYRPKNLESILRPKCSVLYFPVQGIEKCQEDGQLSSQQNCSNDPVTADTEVGCSRPLHILWPHRWEHDKNPEDFFSVIFKLKDSGHDFLLSVIGESYERKPEIFQEAFTYLKDNIMHWGYADSKEEYFSILQSADVVVSTATHEFFGVAMLEAVSWNCYPLCPKKLVYPEIYPDTHLYNTTNQLYKKLKYLCKNPVVARNFKLQVDLSQFSWDKLCNEYKALFLR